MAPLRDTKEGASAVTAGRGFNKLNYKQCVEGENCLDFLVCDILILAVDGVKYDDAGM